MILHPQYINREDKEYVVIPVNEYQQILEMLEDYEDLRDLRKAKEETKGEPEIPLETVMKKFGL